MILAVRREVPPDDAWVSVGVQRGSPESSQEQTTKHLTNQPSWVEKNRYILLYYTHNVDSSGVMV